MQLHKALSSLIWLKSWPWFKQQIALENTCCPPIQNFIWSFDKNMTNTRGDLHFYQRWKLPTKNKRCSECCCSGTVYGRERAADDDWALWDTYRHLTDHLKVIIWKLTPRDSLKMWVDKTVLNQEWLRLNTCFLESPYETIWHELVYYYLFIREPWAGAFEDDFLLQKETPFL